MPFEQIASINGFSKDILERMRQSNRFGMRSLKDWDVVHRPCKAPVWTKKEGNEQKQDQEQDQANEQEVQGQNGVTPVSSLHLPH